MSRFRNVSIFTITAALAGCGSSHTTDEPDTGSIMFDLDGAVFPDSPPPPDAARGTGNVGAACTSGSDCMGAADVCLPDQPGLIPGGYCSAACDPADMTSCPDGSTCVEVDTDRAFCFAECDPDATTRSCRDGYGCATNLRAFPANVCLQGCFDASDCGPGRECNRTGGPWGAGRCFNPGAMVGAACADSSDCSMVGGCSTEEGSGWPGGACLAGECDPVTGTGCAAGGVCLRSAVGTGFCAESCTVDSDCRAEYACRAHATGPDRLYCAPDCESDAECSVPGNVCNTGLGTCAPPFVAGRLGGACSFRTPCSGGTCLYEFGAGYPGGYCAYGGCEIGGTCPDDGVCVSSGTDHLCLAICAADGDCRAGYACRPSDPDDAMSARVCQPACTADDQCRSRSTTCDLTTGFCTGG